MADEGGGGGRGDRGRRTWLRCPMRSNWRSAAAWNRPMAKELLVPDLGVFFLGGGGAFLSFFFFCLCAFFRFLAFWLPDFTGFFSNFSLFFISFHFFYWQRGIWLISPWFTVSSSSGPMAQVFFFCFCFAIFLRLAWKSNGGGEVRVGRHFIYLFIYLTRPSVARGRRHRRASFFLVFRFAVGATAHAQGQWCVGAVTAFLFRFFLLLLLFSSTRTRP